jgi:DNA mismatch repair protein MutL
VADIIQLLPDNIANQIAAGEVIQRPASAVKELLENSVDAGATQIQLIVTDAGKSLVQVIDNGKGMSETDARMCFERHATSKIRVIDDLFRIGTMGFRGEALASIAAVAQVELRSRRPEEELGTCIDIENGIVTRQQPCACPSGTNICMKNLFFNVPARRNFLKSNTAELRHIIDEFIRVAMAFPHIFFSLTSNGQQVFHLEAGSHKQRIIQILGAQYSTKLVSVKEQTDYMNIYGFVGKPDAARKTRGDQYFFVNNRFIRSGYLNHAVGSAFEDLIPKDCFPLYVLYIDLDPSQIDINVHPTKQEIKFEDEKIVYAFVQSAVKHALAQFSIAPSLDFSLNADIQQLEAVSKPFTENEQEVASASNLYKTFTQKHQAHAIEPNEKSELRHWKEFFTAEREESIPAQQEVVQHTTFEAAPPMLPKPVYQLNNTYVLALVDKDLILVHQQLAHERVLYEQLSANIYGKQVSTQKSLFPATLQLSPADSILLEDLLPDLEVIGYIIEPFGRDTFVVQGTPADVQQGNEKQVIELLLEQFKHFTSEVKFSKREKLVRCMARQQAIKAGRALSQQEMETLVVQLFACNTPNLTPGGNPTYIEFKEDYIDRLFVR